MQGQLKRTWFGVEPNSEQSEYSSRIHSVTESCKRSFRHAQKKAKKQKLQIENGTGISPEDSELDLALEEIIEKCEAAEQELQLDNQGKAKKLEKDKETAQELRTMAMETLGASKKRKSDPDESPFLYP